MVATNPWVKSPEEIRRIEDVLAAPAFLDGKTLSVSFLTRPEFVRAVLPPPLKPADEPLMTIGAGSFGSSNCVGAFDGGWVDVLAKYDGIVANYCLAMPMTTDVAIIFGRELFGEPKKQARVSFGNFGVEIRATIERRGVPYIALEATLTERVQVQGPATSDRFHFKFMHAANGRGLEFDPIMVHAHFETKVRVLRRGTGQVMLRQSHHDPLAQIEILEYRGATYMEGDVYVKATKIGSVAAERFLPYSFQNVDDYAGSF